MLVTIHVKEYYYSISDNEFWRVVMSRRCYDLMSSDLMTGPEASEKWGYESGYVRQMYRKYPDRIPEGEIRLFGKTLVITRYGMEQLTGKILEEVWYFYVVKGTMILDEKKYSTYDKALEKLTDYASSNTEMTEFRYLDSSNTRYGYRSNNGENVYIVEKRIQRLEENKNE